MYDQAKLDRLIREPQNTASNLAYAAVGLAVVFAARRPLVRSFGWGCVFLGAGSGLYHASLLSQWRMLDILGVYVVLVTLVAIGTLAVFKISFSQRGEAALALLLWIAACAAGVWRNDVRFWGIKWLDSTYVVVALVAAGSILALAAGRIAREKTRYRWSLAALLVAAPLAFTGGLGDRFGGFWADPEGLVQGHSVWHGFGAVALLAACEVFFTTNWARSVIWQDGKSQ